MDQPTFADLEYQGKKRKTRREVFLERMDGLIPWQLLEERIRPFYPKAGRGRHPCPLSTVKGGGKTYQYGVAVQDKCHLVRLP